MRGIFLILLFAAFFLSDSVWAQGFETLRSGTTVVEFEKTGDDLQIRRFRRSALPEIDQILSELSRDLGNSTKKTSLKIFFYSPETFANRFPSTVEKKIPAFFRRGQGVHARFDNDMNEGLRLTLRHELTHFHLYSVYGSLPSWVDEGLAQHMERKISVDPRPTFPEYNTLVVENQQGNLLSLPQLESSSYYSRSHGTIHASQAYVIGFIAIDELVQRSGMYSMRSFLEKLSKGESASSVFLKSFGLSYEKFDEELLKVAKKGAVA